MTTANLLKEFSAAGKTRREQMRSQSSRQVSRCFDVLEEAENRIYKRINGCILEDIKVLKQIGESLKKEVA